jgi:hypothetical protein
MRLCVLLRRLFFAEPGSYKAIANHRSRCPDGGRPANNKKRVECHAS